MKCFAAMLAVFMVLSLLGCGAPEAKETQPLLPDPAKIDTLQSPEDYIQTDYYRLSVPGNWLMDCVYTSQALKDGGHVLDIYEKQGYEDNMGLLWSVRLFPEGEDFTSFPSHTAYGILKTDNQTYYVVVLTPTDVQYTEETKDQYNKMFAQLGSIMDSLEPKDGCEYDIPQLENIDPLIETDYYSLTLPAAWLDKCVWEISDKDDGTYILTLREKTAYEEMGAGKLCSMMLFPAGDESYKELPDYQMLGSLDTGNGSFYLIALFPTDVQFSESTVERYNEMFDQLQDVLYTLSPAVGVELAMPAPAL